MTGPLPVTETWEGPDGTPWPSGWTITNGGATLRGNRGDLNIDGQTWAGTAAVHPAVVTDVDWLVTFSFDRYGDEVGTDSILWFGARTGVEWLGTEFSQPLRGYVCRFFINPDIDGAPWFIFELHRNDGSGAGSDALSGWFDRPVEPGVDYRLRMRVIGGRVQARYWPVTEAEPSTWSIDWTDPNPLPAGRAAWLGTSTGWGGATRGFRFDDLTINDVRVRLWNGTAEVPASLRVA